MATNPTSGRDFGGEMRRILDPPAREHVTSEPLFRGVIRGAKWVDSSWSCPARQQPTLMETSMKRPVTQFSSIHHSAAGGDAIAAPSARRTLIATAMIGLGAAFAFGAPSHAQAQDIKIAHVSDQTGP